MGIKTLGRFGTSNQCYTKIDTLQLYNNWRKMMDYNDNALSNFDVAEKKLLEHNFECLDDMFVFNAMLWRLGTLKGYSLSSIQEFTIYDFINLESSGDYWIGYENWKLSELDMKLITTYIHKVIFSLFLNVVSQMVGIRWD